MVKFGQRLQEELLVPDWEHYYVQYKLLKKAISKISKHEVVGEMVNAFVAQKAFATLLKESITNTSTFYNERTVLCVSAAAQLIGDKQLDLGPVAAADDKQESEHIPPESARTSTLTGSRKSTYLRSFPQPSIFLPLLFNPRRFDSRSRSRQPAAAACRCRGCQTIRAGEP